MGYVSDAQRKAKHAHEADGGKGHPDNKGPKKSRAKYDKQMEKARNLDKKGSEKDKEKFNSGARLRRRAGRVRGRAGSINDVVEGPGKKDDIKIDKKDQGKFTAWVKKNMPGKDTCAAASSVMKNKKKYTTRVVKMANFAKNFGCKK
tara:strand:+ start:3209 stop:3649 length:441 start_codon:yes stop_codon:yes gene_type:complete